MFRRIVLALAAGLACALAACGGAAPQLIGSYPQSSQSYSPPPAHPDGPAPQQLQITYNAALELEVEEPSSALYSVRSTAEQYGGYLLTSHTWMQDGNEYAEATLAVPVSNFEGARAQLRRLGRVASESVSGELRDTPPNYLGQAANFSNITVTLTPTSANWGGRLVKFLGGVITAIFWILVIAIPPFLMIVGLVTSVRTVVGWLNARNKPKPED